MLIHTRHSPARALNLEGSPVLEHALVDVHTTPQEEIDDASRWCSDGADQGRSPPDLQVNMGTSLNQVLRAVQFIHEASTSQCGVRLCLKSVVQHVVRIGACA